MRKVATLRVNHVIDDDFVIALVRELARTNARLLTDTVINEISEVLGVSTAFGRERINRLVREGKLRLSQGENYIVVGE